MVQGPTKGHVFPELIRSMQDSVLGLVHACTTRGSGSMANGRRCVARRGADLPVAGRQQASQQASNSLCAHSTAACAARCFHANHLLLDRLSPSHRSLQIATLATVAACSHECFCMRLASATEVLERFGIPNKLLHAVHPQKP